MLQWAAKGAAVCVLQIQTRSAAFGNAHGEGTAAFGLRCNVIECHVEGPGGSHCVHPRTQSCAPLPQLLLIKAYLIIPNVFRMCP